MPGWCLYKPTEGGFRREGFSCPPWEKECRFFFYLKGGSQAFLTPLIPWGVPQGCSLQSLARLPLQPFGPHGPKRRLPDTETKTIKQYFAAPHTLTHSVTQAYLQGVFGVWGYRVDPGRAPKCWIPKGKGREIPTHQVSG